MEAFKRKELMFCIYISALEHVAGNLAVQKKGIAIGAAACWSAVGTVAIGTVIVCLYRKKLMARRKYNGKRLSMAKREAAIRKILDWPTRLSIALGAARGLMYLHTYERRSVIHRDVKSSNILLYNNSMCAKVADFGFSKYAPQEGDSTASLEVRGTAGHMDPEYYSTQHLSAKSDVFSFGVVLLEIISGREPLNIHRPWNEWSLVEWAKPYIRESKIDEIVDPNIKGGYHAEAMWRVVEAALACIEPFSAYRPCMADIVRELEDALIIENNASEYMKSIDRIYSLGGSNRFSIVMEEKIILLPTLTASEPSPINTHKHWLLQSQDSRWVDKMFINLQMIIS
ncbi:hypothetical protein CRYUN_Cryun24cG0045300 [Craigia yunnanensis]